MKTRRKFYGAVANKLNSDLCCSSSSSSNSRELGRKRTKRSQKMTGIRQYHDKFVDLFETVCKGKVNLGTRKKLPFWKTFARNFNNEIDVAIYDGQDTVNFTADDCRHYALNLQRRTKLKISGPDQDRLSDLFNFQMPTMNPSKSKSGTSTGCNTAATGRLYSLDKVMDLTSEKRQMLVLAILTNLEGLGVSDFQKVNSYCAKDEDLINMILMSKPANRLAKVKELLQIINARGE